MIKLRIYTNVEENHYVLEIIDEEHKVKINKNKSVEEVIKALGLETEEVEVI